MKSIIDYTNKLKDFFAQKQALSDEVATRAALGAHNLIPFLGLDAIKALNTNGTWSGNVYTHSSGVTITLNDDGTVKVNGIPSVTSYFIYYKETTESKYFLNVGTSYIINGHPSGASSNSRVQFEMNGQNIANSADNGGVFNAPAWNNYVTVILRLHKDEVFSNAVFKPMIRLASDTNPTYQLHAMTNRELTDLLKLKNKDYEVESIAAGSYVQMTDSALGGHIFVGYALTGSASYNLSVTQAFIDEYMLTIVIKNNGSSAATISALRVFYL